MTNEVRKQWREKMLENQQQGETRKEVAKLRKNVGKLRMKPPAGKITKLKRRVLRARARRAKIAARNA